MSKRYSKTLTRSLFKNGGSLCLRFNPTIMQLIGLPNEKGEKVKITYQKDKIVIERCDN
jgi:antitoxin component of MazEF toxin-antitoxin module